MNSFRHAHDSLTTCLKGHRRKPGQVCRRCIHPKKVAARSLQRRRKTVAKRITRTVQAGINSGFFGAWHEVVLPDCIPVKIVSSWIQPAETLLERMRRMKREKESQNGI